MNKLKIRFAKLNPEAYMPTQANESDAGFDLYSTEVHIIKPMERRLVKLGIAVEIPPGYYGRIAPRSGLALKKGIDVMAGVVDSGYRNELGVVLINLNFDIKALIPDAHMQYFGSSHNFTINPGDRIAQLIIEKCHGVEWEEVQSLSESERGTNGFGSSGA